MASCTWFHVLGLSTTELAQQCRIRDDPFHIITRDDVSSMGRALATVLQGMLVIEVQVSLKSNSQRHKDQVTMPNVLSRCIAYVLEVLVASSVSTAPLFDEFVHLFSGKSMFTFFVL